MAVQVVAAIGLLAAESGPSEFLRQEIAAVVLVAIAAVVAVLAARVRFPFTVALVVAGLLATFLGDLVAVDVSADLILALLVPPLLFEATLQLPWPKLRADLFPILLFALVGTAVGTLAIGGLVHWTLTVPWAAAFAFGALISATDPVAVIAFFKALGAPKRLTVLVEGESLFNDAVAVVAFVLAVEAATGEGFSAAGAATDFVVVSAGGLLVGLVLGYLVSAVFLARVDDPLIETTTTLALAYGSFLLAEEIGLVVGQPGLHFSGILAVVASGLVVGNLGLQNTSPSTRLTLEHFWELLTFLVNSMVFLVIGLTISIETLLRNLWAVLVAVVGVLVLRAALTHGLAALAAVIMPKRRIPMPYRHVMVWAGLRGAISLALVLTLDAEKMGQDTVDVLRVMTFGVVLFTLLIQGTTIPRLMDNLGLSGKADSELVQQHHQARLYMSRAGQAEMARLGADGVLLDGMADAMARSYQRDIGGQGHHLQEHFRSNPELEVAMLLQARRDALVVERSALGDVVRSGLVDVSAAHDLSTDLDNRMAAVDLLDERWESDPGTPDGAQIPAASVNDFADLDRQGEGDPVGELIYVSWVGSGHSQAVRQAVRITMDFPGERRELIYLAVLDDRGFADVDHALRETAAEELARMLEVQMDMITEQVGAGDLVTRVLVRSGDVVDQVATAVDTLDAGYAFLGGPLPVDGEASRIVEALGQRLSVPVHVINQDVADADPAPTVL